MWVKKTSSGIGFIEVMTAVVIISIAALGILMGAVHARGQLHALQVKERATEELLNYMEYWKGRIADGVMSSSEWNGDLQGDQIYLFGNAQSVYKVKATVYYDIEKLDKFTDHGKLSP
jgi:Tfp pilus assembly protein PilV